MDYSDTCKAIGQVKQKSRELSKLTFSLPFI